MNINCAEMHSDLLQQERDDVMYRFKAGQVDVLVAITFVNEREMNKFHEIEHFLGKEVVTYYTHRRRYTQL